MAMLLAAQHGAQIVAVLETLADAADSAAVPLFFQPSTALMEPDLGH